MKVLALLLLATQATPVGFGASVEQSAQADAESPLLREGQRLLDEGRPDAAFAMVRDAAETGDAEALGRLAWFYDEGVAVAQDQAEAARLYRRSADLGWANAQWRLGVMMDTGECDCGSPQDAFRLFQQAAAQDLDLAFVSMAVMQATGRGTATDYEAALANYDHAARLGNDHGVQGVGVMHALGQGVVRNPDEAAAWFLVAMSLGSEQAERMLSNLGASTELNERKIIDRANAISAEYEFDATFAWDDSAPD